jgi:hypothetical protein
MTTTPFVYSRQNLAVQYCSVLQGSGVADARSGLFLAAPRRTGKSTFLRTDLVPTLDGQGWVTVYVDLWSDRNADPGRLIAGAIKNALGRYSGAITKMAKSVGLDKVTVFGALSMSLASLDLPANVTLSDALEALCAAADKPVVLIVDEAQHALSSQAGMDAMFALKAARDHLNQGGDATQRLFLVFTGSNQDKLSRLVQKKAQPFFGSSVTRFPLLGKGYSDGYTAHINAKLSPDNQFTEEVMWEAFQLVGQRPEKLRDLVASVALEQGAGALAEGLKTGAAAFQDEIWSDMESEFNALSIVQQAVLVHLIAMGKRYEPFTQNALEAYAAYAGKEVTSSDAQAALNALREKNLVWKATHGDYALEDESMALWYKARN